MSEFEIIIRNQRRPISSRLKTLVRPRRRRDDYGRRRNSIAVQFYDLARVNTGTAGSPVWSDHPILKAAAYTVEPTYNDFMTGIIGLNYRIEQFANSDYQDFTDMILGIGPVADWPHLFKRLDYEKNPETGAAYPATYPTGLRVRYVPQTGPILTKLLTDNDIDLSAPGAGVERHVLLNSDGYVWDRRGMEYRNFTELTINFISGFIFGGSDWFTLSTQRKGIYKLTATYDPDAPDVGDLAVTGNIDCYLMPQIGCQFGAAYLGADDNPGGIPHVDMSVGFNVLGPWYQVLPRVNWPGFVDPYLLADQELLKAAYIDYQAGRSGAQASFVQVVDNSFPGAIFTDAIAPTAFLTGASGYISGMDNAAGDIYYNVIRTSSPITADPRYVRTDKMLMAVLKVHGRFYYVWCMDGDTAAGETLGAGGYQLWSHNYLDV